MPSIKSFSVLLLLIVTSKCIVSTIPTVKPPHSNQAYAISTEAVSWEKAFILCKQRGMDLASSKTPEEHDAIGQTLSSNSTKLVSSDFKYVVIKAKVAWDEAFVLCKQHGMDLVSIKSAGEDAALSEALSSHHMKEGGEHGYWISARRFSKNSFVWFASGQPMVYTNFAEGQPDNVGNHEDCVEYFLQSEELYKWNDMPCDHKRGYICQVRNVLY